MREKITILKENLARTIVGKDDAIKLVLVALLSGGHALLEDVPGVGKTLLAKSLAKSINGKFQRIQCTPDLLPSDVTGTNVWNPNSREFEFLAGPAFANVLLADEINRATPRTQSALLEVMEEKQITIDGVAKIVPIPFFVIATQNPVEYQGTFPLPEAQMDRFAISLSLGYPSFEEELQMLEKQLNPTLVEELEPCVSLQDVKDLQKEVFSVRVAPEIQKYIVNLINASRQDDDIALGVSPRGTIALQKASQALAFLEGRDYVIPDDIKFLAPSVLSHRLIPAGGRNAKVIVARLLNTVAIAE
ncbi:MoxR family ATPase [Cyanobacterium aponinum UTEX 3222]|uniref:ATPase associated with various cellular activities AAA_3 n=3 Tax=Cyanobacterium aponinum TaxID=379064 RepID=K9Z5H7_CYAAP|nr:MoxR family ATPase [Cyanobacterium aponinum]WRL41264.1 MoxR family ATPase [Cyanobacterium aponinum UTEX 3222]AFZ53815.1 ATPase associated with various cellular activities AAA_3 [Cyanobacterium aponinum PCC 10605]MBD2395236.1 MoxR family ATPase [Cyanobacterium aponinum FACHB-4101]MTF39769.1 AAA domain-containing protein [Cyanobacterium aponinum 0216]PHV61511.1 MoxR family ATPase [Cyanobacterium aponinum IPPAS B-1201]